MIMRSAARRRHRLFYGPRRAAAAKRNKVLAGAAAGTDGEARARRGRLTAADGRKGEGLAAAACVCTLSHLLIRFQRLGMQHLQVHGRIRLKHRLQNAAHVHTHKHS